MLGLCVPAPRLVLLSGRLVYDKLYLVAQRKQRMVCPTEAVMMGGVPMTRRLPPATEPAGKRSFVSSRLLLPGPPPANTRAHRSQVVKLRRNSRIHYMRPMANLQAPRHARGVPGAGGARCALGLVPAHP